MRRFGGSVYVPIKVIPNFLLQKTLNMSLEPITPRIKLKGKSFKRY